MVKNVLTVMTFFCTLVSLEAKHAIILVHGAFAAKNSWMHSTSKFYKAIQKTTNSLTKIESFYWDQPFEGIFAFEKITAAKKLADLVLKLKGTGYNHIEVYAHSYGGQIAAIASQLLSSDNEKLEIILQKEKIDKTNISPEVSDSYQQANRFFQEKKREVKEHLTKTPVFVRQSQNSYCINIIHTFAMPHHDMIFRTDMNSVEYLLNWWSRDPRAQNLVGSFKLFTDHTRSCNLEYIISEEQQHNDGWISVIFDSIAHVILETIGLIKKPNNLAQYSKILGKWLPALPWTIAAENLNNFENFSFKNDGIIEFSLNQHKPPCYRSEIR